MRDLGAFNGQDDAATTAGTEVEELLSHHGDSLQAVFPDKPTSFDTSRMGPTVPPHLVDAWLSPPVPQSRWTIRSLPSTEITCQSQELGFSPLSLESRDLAKFQMSHVSAPLVSNALSTALLPLLAYLPANSTQYLEFPRLQFHVPRRKCLEASRVINAHKRLLFFWDKQMGDLKRNKDRAKARHDTSKVNSLRKKLELDP